ncbi:MAG: hypothetical protein O7G84_02700 [Gammaproteobacteria bacterium]|nr:hypothetical protein [Gammaproteobacteria bacterium]
MRFVRGMLRSRPHVLAWLMLLMLANGIAPLVFLARLEAQVVFATFLLSIGLMTWLTARYGFSRILGLGHVLWVPMVIFLLVRANALEMDAYGIWVGTVVVLNVISLMIDVRDVTQYVRGDKDEVVKGL